MKKILSYGAVIIITSIFSILAFEVFQNESPEQGVISASLQSTVLNEKRDVIIRLPRLYDSTKRYPVFYVLDGGSLDRIISDKLEVLSSTGHAPEAIVVGIPNMTDANRQKNLVPPFMHVDSEDPESAIGEGGAFLEFIEDELIPFVENKYKTTSRGFCGNSRGGLLVMYSLIHKPMLFDSRICFSSPFWREENILIDSIKRFLSARDSLNTFIFLSAGSSETENVKGGVQRMTNSITDAHIRGLIVHSITTPEAVHADNAEHSAARAIDALFKYRKSKELVCHKEL